MLLFLALFFITNLNAQHRITGIITDVEKNPLEYANVVLKNATTNQLITGVITNSQGEFEISLKTSQKVIMELSFIGYTSVSKQLHITKNSNLGVFILKEDSNLLESVTITATKPMLSRREDKLVFNVQNSPLKINANGMEVLRQTPLLWVEENSISMRNEAVVVFVNGKKINLSGDQLTNYVRTIKSENIKSIEITTSKSAKLDANSKGGSINIILLKKRLGFNGSVHTAYKFAREGYYQTYASSNFNYGAETWNLYGNYNNVKYTGLRRINILSNFSQQQSQIETLNTENYNDQRHYSQLGFVSSFGTNHELGIEVFSAIVNKNSPILADLSFYKNQVLEDKGQISTTNTPKNNLFTAVVNYSWKIDKNQALKVFADYLNQNNAAKRTTKSVYSMGNFEDTFEKYDADASAISYALQTDYAAQVSKKTKLETGFKYGFIDKGNDLLTEYEVQNTFIIDPNRTTSLDYKEQISAAYMSVSSNFTATNFLKLGLRVENTSLNRINNYTGAKVTQNYTNWFPSIFYSKKLASTKSISASYSRSIQRPSFQLLNNEIQKINDFNFIVGNPDLTPEFKNAFEITYQQKKNVISLYYNRTIDNINAVYFVENDIAYLKNQNIGTHVEYGVEYGSSKKLTNWWSLQYSATLFHSKFLDGNQQSNFEKTSLYTNFSTNFTLNNTTHFDVIGRYISPTTAPFNENEAYHSFIFVFKKSFLQKKLQLRVTIDDVFNTIKYNSVNTFENYTTRKADKPMTQKMYVGLTYNFTSKAKTASKRNRSKNDARRRL
ncbi:outer membrane beta-barrel protein [Polaribacter ponticola]|uniref:Outer membrane beta-barrel family protein n=1 Tax=Polaribacter ponticola TaxID=2978475 RepID=A0ABT5S7F1_9FLAO|nr:outer membrane beta-barrel family protein [Polaribacter sp. MSW5]MDD7914034.1 outer membrane beta-barrel family protein [Polaribacter sp. MSW5]